MNSSHLNPGAGGHAAMQRISMWLNLCVLALSAGLVAFISYDTLRNEDFMQNRAYMQFQLWVCIFFIADYFIGLYTAPCRRRFFFRRLAFLVLSVPYLNIVEAFHISLDWQQLYLVRFIPLARGALALWIVVRYLSRNTITSLFFSYLLIALTICYFSALIFYHCEQPVNPEVNSFWTALWWAGMNMGTVGCRIPALSVPGQCTAVLLAAAGMITFPLFTVYLTDYVRRKSHTPAAENEPSQEENA